MSQAPIDSFFRAQKRVSGTTLFASFVFLDTTAGREDPPLGDSPICKYICIDTSESYLYDGPVSKTEQLQVRVTAAEKAALKRLARGAGQDLSSYVLSRALPKPRLQFQELVEAVAHDHERRYALAELNDLLSKLSGSELADTLGDAPNLPQSPYWRNYVAAMVEQAAHQKKIPAPKWLAHIDPLTEPHFAAPLASLRLHLLRVSPVSFRRRNIFVDSAVGDRV